MAKEKIAFIQKNGNFFVALLTSFIMLLALSGHLMKLFISFSVSV